MNDPELTITPQLLLRAYMMGIFPMAEHRDDPQVFWVDPKRRGVLPLNGFHISRSLARRMRKGGYTATLNRDFAHVVAGCAERDETWINAEIRSLYQELHHRGHAHSLEIWQDDALAGGVYGVAIGAAFFGESMFSRRRDASKLALAHLVDHLRRCKYRLFDTQFITPHLRTLGAREISRACYRSQLAEVLELPASITAVAFDPDPYSVLQRSTQTS